MYFQLFLKTLFLGYRRMLQKVRLSDTCSLDTCRSDNQKLNHTQHLFTYLSVKTNEGVNIEHCTKIQLTTVPIVSMTDIQW